MQLLGITVPISLFQMIILKYFLGDIYNNVGHAIATVGRITAVRRAHLEGSWKCSTLPV